MLPRSYQLLTLLAGFVLPAVSHGFITFEVCYDFGCRNQNEVVLDESEWQSVASIVDAGDAAEERQQIKRAIARMESLVGHHTPTHKDLAMNLPVTDGVDNADLFPGQLDCIDESINTTRYLQLMASHGLLQFHSVLNRAYRRSFITQHWAAKIEDVQTGRQYVIDSWFEKNGEPPVLVSSERWYDLSL